MKIPNWLQEELPYNHSWINVGKEMHIMEKGKGMPIEVGQACRKSKLHGIYQKLIIMKFFSVFTLFAKIIVD